jgi:hypothetical protein
VFTAIIKVVSFSYTLLKRTMSSTTDKELWVETMNIVGHLWIEALAAVDMGLAIGDWNACVNLQQTLLANNSGPTQELAASWRNIYGHTPPIVHELVNVRKTCNVPEMALTLGRLRYTFLALNSNPTYRYQVHLAASERLGAESVLWEYHQKGYVSTHAKVMVSKEGMDAGNAAAHAYFMHTKLTLTASGVEWVKNIPALDIVNEPPAAADQLHLPCAYLGVDARGKLVLLDSTRGTSNIAIGNVVPHEWIVRVSEHSNEFLAGNIGCALHITLNEPLTIGTGTPVALPMYPFDRVHEVDNTWVVWRTNNGPRALQWNSTLQRASLCSAEDARLYAVINQSVYSRRNSVWRDATCIARLPSSESITAVWGTAVGFDAFTKKGDWWRVDVRARKAWVVGVPTVNEVCSVAPLVTWSG